MKRFAPPLMLLFLFLCFVSKVNAVQTLSGAGWHLAAPGGTANIGQIFSDNSDLDSIWSWTGSQWEIALQVADDAPPAPSTPEYPQLLSLSANKGYWFKTSGTVVLPDMDTANDATLDLDSLSDGWHLVGQGNSLNILSDVQTNLFDSMAIWAWVSGQWSVYTLGDQGSTNQFNDTYDTNFGTLRTVGANEAYWMRITWATPPVIVDNGGSSGGNGSTIDPQAEANYQSMCASCHGSQGEGGLAVTLQGCSQCNSLEDLTTKIADTMPLGTPTQCAGDCASGLATYIVESLNGTAQTVDSVLSAFATGEEQRQILCTRLETQNIRHTIRDSFCGDVAPTLDSLRDLQAEVGLAFDGPQGDVALLEGFRENNLRQLVRLNGRQGNPEWTLVGSASSLGRREANNLNPRAIIFDKPRNQGLMAMGFVRGDQFVEMIAQDHVTDELHFFLLTYQRACDLNNSCSARDRFSEETENDWLSYTLYSDEELKNTIFDCLQCHQSGTPESPGSKRSLLMQEFESPWEHWFMHRDRARAREMMVDYFDAHGTEERYAGIPPALIGGGDPRALQDFIIDNGFGDGFDTEKSRQEARRSGRFTDGNLRELNEAGKIIQPPTRLLGRATMDNAKRIANIQGYKDFRAGLRSDPPIMTDSFPDSASGLADHYLRVTPGASGETIILQSCTQCHANHLDQTISRARFDVNSLSSMSDEELQVAQARINLAEDHLKVMPPTRFRTLSTDERARAVAYLQTLIDAN